MPSLKELFGTSVHRFQRRIVGEASILSLKRQKSSKPTCITYEFSDEIWNAIFNHCSPFDLFRWRRVSKRLKRLIDGRFKNILYLNADRRNIANFLAQPSKVIDGSFCRHRSAQMLLGIDTHSATFVVHERWTVRDVIKTFHAIQAFAPMARTVTMDMAILELLIAGLSSMELTRWHAFQCYLRSLDGQMGEDSIHVQCSRCTRRHPLFSNVKEFTVQIYEWDYPALTRLSDYLVPIGALLAMNNLDLFRLHLITTNVAPDHIVRDRSSRKRMSKHLYNFKRWIGAAQLCERYCQQYS